MNIPINGRIAIIDDQYDQALPLINVLSKNQKPHTYYSGDLKFLPEEGKSNDVRVLFLDINLTGNSTQSNKVIKGQLISVLKRVISKDNYPYIIVLWSRNETEYKDLIQSIFDNDLSDRKPINICTAVKSDYVDLDGTVKDDYAELFKYISDELKKELAYSFLIEWENSIHIATDKTLQDVFRSYQSSDDWTNNANFILNKLGESFSGKVFSKENSENKIKSSFNALNLVLNDTIDQTINSLSFPEAVELESKLDGTIHRNTCGINSKLILNSSIKKYDYPGAVIQDQNSSNDPMFKEVLNISLNRKHIRSSIQSETSNREVEKQAKKIRNEIYKDWVKVYLSVSPLCDYLQNKLYFSRCLSGIMVPTRYKEYIDKNSEAIFVSPSFQHMDEEYFLIFHFRFFFTVNKSLRVKGYVPLFKLRLQLLSEIQSKLARHVNRQGVVYLED